MSKKSFVCFFVIMFVLLSAHGQVRHAFNYQAVLRDEAGQIIESEDVTVDVAILKNAGEGGDEIFSETHNTKTNAFGLVNLEIGSINSLEGIEWGNHTFYLSITVDGHFMGSMQLLSVPYALHAHSSSDTFSGDYEDLDNLPDLDEYVSISGVQHGDMIYFGTDDWALIPIGQDGQILTAKDGIPVWAYPEDTTPTYYTLSLVSSPEHGGEVIGEGEYYAGERVIVEAIPSEHYSLAHWKDSDDNILGDDLSFEFIMPSKDEALTAYFDAEDGAPGSGVTDIDGNEYRTVIIGNKEYMAENLLTTRYNDGSEIVTGLNDDEWRDTFEGAYAIYDHTREDAEGVDSEEQMVEAYGKLYNWFAVEDERGLCPEGWYVPSDDEWRAMFNYLMDTYDEVTTTTIGNKLKEARQIDHPWGGDHDTEEHPRWHSHNIHYGVDKFGFAASPTGFRPALVGSTGNYTHITRTSRFWTTTEYSATSARYWGLGFYTGNRTGGYCLKANGWSVRCVRDLD